MGFTSSYKGAVKAALDLPEIKPLATSHKIRLNQALLVYAHLPTEQLEPKLKKLDFMSKPRVAAVVSWHAAVTPKLQGMRNSRI
ncbi:Uncharacterised protein [Candidatus Norongarragalina meridionalis]|nr:Uncharacterised protein [Candidatus Norongarragalina meridionalis]